MLIVVKAFEDLQILSQHVVDNNSKLNFLEMHHDAIFCRGLMTA